MRRKLCALAPTIAATLFASLGSAAEFAWAGMRNPCKQSAEDGLDSSQLGKKIGTFINLADKGEWAQAVFNVNNRFPESKPWVTWAVGAVRERQPEARVRDDHVLRSRLRASPAL